MKKRGQFYIIAAIIIVAFLIGLIVLNSQTRVKKEYKKIYNLGEELEIETGNVYDYGTYLGINTDNLIADWADTYYDYTNAGVIEDWIFIYGDDKEMTVLTFTTVSEGEIGIIVPGTDTIKVDIKTKGKSSGSFIPNLEGNVEVIFEGITYEFNLSEGENFFFVIRGGDSSIEN